VAIELEENMRTCNWFPAKVAPAIAVVVAFLAVGAAAQDNSAVQGPATQQTQNRSNARILSGTRIIVRISDQLSSATANSGQHWTGSLVNDIRDGDTVVAPQGSEVDGVVTSAKSSGRLGGTALLSLQVTTINGIPVASDTLSRDGAGHTKSNVAKIGGTAAAGAILGGLFGGGKGAAIGTVAGAGAGTAGAAATGKKEAVIAQETALTFTTQ
jgi:hypothetical protein